MTAHDVIPALIGRAGAWAGDQVLGRRVSTLIFHRVLPEPDPLFPEEMHAQRFDRLMGIVARAFNVLTVGQAAERMAAGTLPPRALCITFDDGYADNAEIALPILRRHGLQASFFIAHGFLDGGWMFNDIVIETLRRTRLEAIDLGLLDLGVHAVRTPTERRRAIERALPRVKYATLARRRELLRELARAAGYPDIGASMMMRAQQVVELQRADMEIGGHTVNHPILAQEDDQTAAHEISAGRKALQDLVDAPVSSFAYPNGRPGADYLDRHVEMVKLAGFKMAVTTSPGTVTGKSPRFQWPRFSPWDQSAPAWMVRLLRQRFSSG